MRASGITRWGVVGALLLTVISGPALALCMAEPATGCCCSPRGCPTEPSRSDGMSMGCCGATDPARETPVTAPLSTSSHPECAAPELAQGVTLAEPSGNRANQGVVESPDPPLVALFTLHAAYLI